MKKYLIIFVIFIVGCSNNETQQGSLFLLPTNITTPIVSKNAPTLIVKTDLAEYLDQTALVYRTSVTEVILTKQNSWAHKISTQINQRMILNLRSQQSTYWPVQINSALKLNKQPQLQLRLTKFNGAFTGNAEISGEWLFIDAQGTLVKSEYFEITKPLKNEGYEQLVLSLAEGLDELSAQIAKQINLLAN